MKPKLIVADDSQRSSFIEYINTISGYSVLGMDQLGTIQPNDYEEIIVVQSEDCLDVVSYPNVTMIPYENIVTHIKETISRDTSISKLVEYIKSCYSPKDVSEFVVLKSFDADAYNGLKQDGIMIVTHEIPTNEQIENKDCIVILPSTSILRKNYPLQIEWLKEDNSIEFDMSNEPLYRRFVPPPIETVDHTLIISSIVSATNPSHKTYVEYGVRSGTSLEVVAPLVLVAHGIDVNDYTPSSKNILFHRMLTDTFSQTQLPSISYDYAFIDADHSSNQVLIDFEHIYNYINPGGYIFLHDTYPCEPTLLQPHYCNDCYQTPLLIRKKYPSIQMLTLPLNPGLTIIHKV